MPNALDTFRAHRETADHVYARLAEITDLLARSRARSTRSRRMPNSGRSCARSRVGWNGFRWPCQTSGTRTGTAAVLAGCLAPVATRPGVRLSCHGSGRRRLRVGVAAVCGGTRGAAVAGRPRTDAVAPRTMAMSPAERRQFDPLMQWNAPVRR